MTKVLILTADAGFGHRSASKAIGGYLQNQPGFEIKIQNLLDDSSTPGFLRQSQFNYDKIVRETPKFYEFTYEQSDGVVPATIAQAGLSAMLYNAFSKAIDDYHPDVIINTYPLYHGPAQTWYLLNEKPSSSHIEKNHKVSALSIKEKTLKKHLPFISVVTDLVSVHSFWYSTLPDAYCVASESIKKEAMEHGVLEDRIYITGIPVNSIISQNIKSKEELRREFGLDPNITTVLAIGSVRVPNLMDDLHILNHSGFNIQIVMAAGGNETLYQNMLSEKWHIPVKIYNFCNTIPNLMLASDFIITKAGGLVTSESMAAGLPMLFVEVLPGQETGNAKLVEDAKAGKVITDPLNLLENVCHLMENNGCLLHQYQKNTSIIGKPHATEDIFKIIQEKLEKADENGI